VRSLVRHATKGPLGDSGRHLDRDALERGFAALAPPPRDRGTLALIVARGKGSARELPKETSLTVEEGVPGDLWAADDGRPETQLAVMRADVAGLIANGQALSLFGDNLLVDLDLSSENLPPGSRLALGGALLEVTPEPHNGCVKFRQRFGGDALRLTADVQLRDQHLRGIYLKVVEPGAIAVGDAIEVVSRAGSGPQLA
jgi:MOSC domain-containing protein YiiM